MRLIQLLFVAFLIHLPYDLSAAILDPDVRWQPGSTIKVWFIDGDRRVHQLVQLTAEDWTRYANINFQFTSEQPESSHIRISFKQYDGTMLGRQPLTNSDEPNAYFATIANLSVALETRRRIILHEFGHILGFEHEFLHPDWPYGEAWLNHQKENCALRLPELSDYDTSNHCETINQPLMRQSMLTFPFDRLSIMQYPTPAKWLERSLEAIPENTRLSTLDKIAATIAYPESQQTNQGLRFVNRCLETLRITYRLPTFSGKASIGSKNYTLSLKPMEISEWIKLKPSEVSWRAISQSGKEQWRNDYSNNRFLNYPVGSWHQGNLEIPVYCNY